MRFSPVKSEVSPQQQSKKSPTGPTERTPKPEYLIVLQLTERGPLVRSHSIFDGNNDPVATHRQIVL